MNMCMICGAPTELVQSLVPTRMGDRTAPPRAWYQCTRREDHSSFEAYRDDQGILHYRRVA